MRAHSHEQFQLNEKRLKEADKLLQTLWEDFVEVNDFLKDCELKENESYGTVKWFELFYFAQHVNRGCLFSDGK